MSTPKITRQEPEGPLRTGLKGVSEALGDNGGAVFGRAYDLANGGLDAVLDLHHMHQLGDPDHSIPPAYQAVQIKRKRGVYSETPAEQGIARL